MASFGALDPRQQKRVSLRINGAENLSGSWMSLQARLTPAERTRARSDAGLELGLLPETRRAVLLHHPGDPPTYSGRPDYERLLTSPTSILRVTEAREPEPRTGLQWRIVSFRV